MSRRALPPVAPRPVPAPRSVRVDQIVGTARRLVEDQGATALTMRQLADDLGIKAPSLYKHLPGRDAVVSQLIDDTLFEAGDRLHAAVSAAGRADSPVRLLLETYRDFGRAHPHLYRLLTTGTLPRAALTPGLEAWAGEPFYRATADSYRAQALWAFAHGTLILEIDQRFVPGSDLDDTWLAGAHVFDHGTFDHGAFDRRTARSIERDPGRVAPRGAVVAQPRPGSGSTSRHE